MNTEQKTITQWAGKATAPKNKKYKMKLQSEKLVEHVRRSARTAITTEIERVLREVGDGKMEATEAETQTEISLENKEKELDLKTESI